MLRLAKRRCDRHPNGRKVIMFICTRKRRLEIVASCCVQQCRSDSQLVDGWFVELIVES
jgi:hypothetical protein